MLVSPKISVITPAYNAEAYIGAAIVSVLQQTLTPTEIIVVDDGSIDKTADVIKQFDHIIYMRQENKGPAAARNAGIKMAQGDWIAFLDADDLWDKNKLALHYDYFKKNSGVEIVRGYSKPFRENPGEEGQSFSPVLLTSFVTGLFKRQVFEKYGLLDEALFWGEDTDWFLRATQANTIIYTHQEIVHFYRLHADNVTRRRNLDIDLNILFKIVKNSRDRQRQ